MKDNDLEISNYEGVIDHINTLVRRIGGSEGLRLLLDNILVTQLIENLLGKHIDSAFPAAHYTQREIDDFKRYFAMVNDTLDTMTDYYTKLGAVNPASHCRFYCMEQLYHLIRRSNNADDLHREISEVYVSTGTQNFWNELAIRVRMGLGKEIN